MPLSGSLLCKPGFPELRSCGEETKKKWIEVTYRYAYLNFLTILFWSMFVAVHLV